MSFSSEQKRPFSGRNQSDQIILDDLSADDAEYNSKSAATRPNMICPVCDKCFSNKSNLKSHVKRFHPTFDVKNFGSRILEFKCDKCERQFSLEKNLKFHKRKHLDNFVERLVVCPVCRQEKEEHLMRDHYAECHEIQIQTSEMSFHSFEDFSAWKIDMEKSTKSSYVRCGEQKNKDGTVKRYYRCHRSGTFSSESQGVRHLKRGGSCKMDAKCPASLKVKIKANGECFAEFQSVHAGHDGDIGYIALSSEERASLAMKIAAKIPFDVILDEVRDSVTESSLERLHLLTKKDLHNIKKCFDITSESSKHSKKSFILKELSHPPTEENLDKFKESLLREYSEMINSLENVNQCKIMAKRKKTLLVELNAEKETPARFLPQTSKAREPANKNIVPQRKFKSLKKRNLEASTSRDYVNNMAL